MASIKELIKLLIAVAGSNAAAAQSPADTITPGAEFRIEAPESGSFALVYVPEDYTPDEKWPVILCYHGAGGRTTTWPFRQVTRGKGFVVIGMNYVRQEYYRTLPPEETHAEKEYLSEVLDEVAKQLSIDRRIFMGGFSQGGYSAGVLGEQLLDDLAGLIILGAGRRNLNHHPPPRASLKDKPIFIGVGKGDKLHNSRARQASSTYKSWGARVTFEEWPQLGHQPDTNSAALNDWLTEVARQVREDDLAESPAKAKRPKTAKPKRRQQ